MQVSCRETTILVRYLKERAPQNFGVSFSIISILTGIPPMFLFGLVSIPQRISCSVLLWIADHWRASCYGVGLHRRW
jgi:hypothetical protein